jgi:hypothetical protein
MLLSCLLTSKPSRWGCLQRSILDYSRQTYADRELIVVVSDPSYAANIDSFVTQLGTRPKGFKLFLRPNARAAREGYVFAMCQARGDYITLWDDANLNIDGRLTWQMDEQKKHPEAITVCQRGMYFFYETHELFLVDFAQPNAPPSERCCVSTAIYPRDKVPAMDGNFSRTPISSLLDAAVRERSQVLVLSNMAYVHVVGVLGDDMRKNHRKLATESPLAYTAEQLGPIRPQLEQAIQHYHWPDDQAIDVSGTDGVAYSLTPSPDALLGSLFPVMLPQPPKDVEVVDETQGT